MTERDVEDVLAEYALGKLQVALPFDSDPRRPWRVSTDRGDFVVRECFLNKSPRDLESEHSLSLCLRNYGFPVSVPLATRRGETWCQKKGRLFAVCTVISGTPFHPGNATQASNAGTALARFHEIASVLPQARGRDLPQGFRSPCENARSLRRAHPRRPEIDSLVDDFKNLDHELRSHPLQEALLFNDFHPRNVLFAHDEFSGAFDLDCCYWGPQLLDVALSLLGFSLSLEGEPGAPASAVLYAACGRSFLEGYCGQRPIPTQEQRLLPTALRRRVRANALFDLREVAATSRRWVQHEWELSKQQIDLVDRNCDAIIEDMT